MVSESTLKSVFQLPGTMCIICSSPSPSRQNLMLASKSRVRIAAWCIRMDEVFLSPWTRTETPSGTHLDGVISKIVTLQR